jgi:hypothetical protein
MTKIAGSGSFSQRHGSADPDPHQNVTDPQLCCKEYLFRHNHYFGDYFRNRRPFSHPGGAAVSRLLSGAFLRPLPRPGRPTMQENVRRHQRLCLSTRVGFIPLYEHKWRNSYSCTQNTHASGALMFS